MPIGKYFKGNGKKVMANMVKEYGDKEGEKVFYATANKKNQVPMKMLAKPKKKRG